VKPGHNFYSIVEPPADDSSEWLSAGVVLVKIEPASWVLAVADDNKAYL